jgi:hypothetical protein
LVDDVVVVFGDCFEEKFLCSKDGGKQSNLDGRSVVKSGGVGDSGDNRSEGGVDEILEGVGGVEEVLKLEASFVVDEVWSA